STLALPVTVFKISKPKSLSIELQYPGKTKSISKVTITARITGFLEKKIDKFSLINLSFKIELM
ncbi:MAG: hypothetical protein ABDH16_04980, partial [Thermodesulfovibrionaceae bacterium]